MVVDERLQALLEQGEEAGCLNLSAVSEFLQEADLDEDQHHGDRHARDRDAEAQPIVQEELARQRPHARGQ